MRVTEVYSFDKGKKIKLFTFYFKGERNRVWGGGFFSDSLHLKVPKEGWKGIEMFNFRSFHFRQTGEQTPLY